MENSNSSVVSRSIDFRLLQSFLEALPDPCVVIDGAGRLLAVNRAWQELPRSEKAAAAARNPVGMDYLAMFLSTTADDSVSRALAGIKEVLGGQRDHYEQEYILPTRGILRWFRMTVREWRQFGASAIVFHRDITSEKMGHAESPTVEEEFRLLADSAPTMIWMSGPTKGCVFVSRRWLEFTGARLEEMLGTGWVRRVHPEDRDELLQAFETAFDQRREFSHEYRLQHNDGSYRWVRDSGSPRFDAHNQFSGFSGSVWDLSEQKRVADEADRAARYSRLVQDIADIANTATTMREALQRSIDTICVTMGFPVGHALLIHDDEPGLAKSSHVVYNSDPLRFAALFEMSSRMTWPSHQGAPGEALRTGNPIFNDTRETSKFPERYPRAQATLAAGLRTGIHLPVLVDDKVEAIIEFGSEYLLVSDRAVRDTLVAASERLSRFFERRRAQIKFLQQKEELQESAERLFAVAGQLVDSQEEERRRIAREIHDDFTQRLALVSMKIGNLAGRDRASTQDEVDAGLEDIRKATAAVANDLRDLSHKLHPAMLEILGLVGALRAQCEDIQRARGIATEFEAEASDQDASPQAAMCLYRVLQESLMNVAKHSGSASARVSLARKANVLEMRVRDKGRGIEPGAEGRMGIGLKGMEERVGLLNGQLIVNSAPGRGTEIIVTVPAAQLT
jgi:PAS domain S-box-containing protein